MLQEIHHLAGEMDENGYVITGQVPLPVIDELKVLTPAFRQRLEQVARELRIKGRVPREVLVSNLLALCTGRFMTLRADGAGEP
jgi:ATP-dependent DNA helicase RecG